MDNTNDASQRFVVGQQVRQRSSRDRVGVISAQPRQVGGESWYPVFFGGIRAINVPESDLELYEAGRSIEDLLREGVFANKEAFSKLITFTKLEFPLRNNLYSFRATRTQFLPYQFKPLLKFLDSPKQRLLIADEVGLGKTIEAGLILAELRARHPQSMDRVLIVCPSALCSKWRSELKLRFDEDFKVFDVQDTRAFLEEFDNNGEATKLRAICSLQMIRGRQVMEQWEAVSPTLDLLVMDEAHHLRNPETLSHRMARNLAESADSVLLLTATPIHLGNVNLFYLLRILDPEQFGTNATALVDELGELFFRRIVEANEPVIEALRVLRASIPADLDKCERLLRKAAASQEGERFSGNPLYEDVLRKLHRGSGDSRSHLIELQRDVSNLNLLGSTLTRTRKREVEARVLREARLIRAEWTPAEQQFYNAVTRHVLAQYQSFEGTPFAAFLVMMPQRQVASCIPAMVERYESELGLGGGGIESELSDLQLEDWSNDAESAASSDPLHLDLGEVIRQWRAAGSPDTKFTELLNTLRLLDEIDPKRKVLIFAYFKQTLYYLSRCLSQAGYSNAVISGDVPDDERQERIANFRDEPDLRVLLSSEVGSEGLDFQFCNTMVNYDLPWNPMVVEQRIGRLDRIGQKAPKITIFNFSIPGTIEDKILTRLYSRIRIFEESIGDLEPILGEEIGKLTRELLSSDLSPGQQEEKIKQVADALERRRQELVELEAKSARFLGHDEFFTDEMDRVLKRKRFISAEELIIFVHEFLSNQFPKCTFEKLDGSEYEFPISDDLEQFVVRQIADDDPTLFEFRRRCGKGPIRLTFDSDVALSNRELDFITVHHPLVRAIVRYYEEHLGDLHPIAGLSVRGGVVLQGDQAYAIAEGDYLYFVYRLEIQGARPDRTLQAVFVSEESGAALGKDAAEDLLTVMITRGETLETMPAYDADRVTWLQDQADAVFGEHLEQRKMELTKLNEGLVNSRLVSLEQSYRARIEKKEQQLTNARQKSAPANYIRMLEGATRRLRLDLDGRREEIEKARKLDISFLRVAAGVVRIQ
jgi:superfamily II DNA or RNA helicase